MPVWKRFRFATRVWAGPAATLTLALACTAALAPPALAQDGNPFGETTPANRFVGTFANGAMTMVVQGDGTGNYRGSITFNGQSMPFTGTAQGDKLSGSFTLNGNAYPFTATVAGDEA